MIDCKKRMKLTQRVVDAYENVKKRATVEILIKCRHTNYYYKTIGDGKMVRCRDCVRVSHIHNAPAFYFIAIVFEQ